MRLFTVLVCVFVFALRAVTAAALPRQAQDTTNTAALAATFSNQVFTLAEYDFDDLLGGPDPQGWTGADLTEQTGAYFHVDNFAGLPAPYAPIAGSKSLWCGVACGTGVGCLYATPPGYGNNWLQDFTSNALPVVAGDVSFSFDIQYDVEEDYDFVRVQYLSKTDRWRSLADYTGSGSAAPVFVIPGDSLAGAVTVRFRVESDATISDEDGEDHNGAAIIDNLSLTGAGLAEFQDFESEAVGDTATIDGDWGALRYHPFGDYSGVFDGASVLQEDPSLTNSTHFLAFFNGSPDDYGCGGHPEQLAVPTKKNDATQVEDFFHNEIRSPLINLDMTSDGSPVPEADTLLVQFDAYQDLPFANAVFFNVRARFTVEGTLGLWHDPHLLLFGNTKTWVANAVALPIPTGATQVQVALEVIDECPVFCPPYSSGTCHSHAPLFDNVAVMVKSAAMLSTGLPGGTIPVRPALQQNVPNPFNPSTTIHYDVPAGGSTVTIRIYDLSGRLVRTLVDRVSPAGPATVNWDGRDASGQPQASGVYFCQMVAGTFKETRKMALLK